MNQDIEYIETLLERISSKFDPNKKFEVSFIEKAILLIFWRARSLFDGIILLMKNGLTEEAMFLSRSLFTDSLRLQELDENKNNRSEIILGWINSSLVDREHLLKEIVNQGYKDSEPIAKSLENQKKDINKYIEKNQLGKLLNFSNEKNSAAKMNRLDDYWFYLCASKFVHGSDLFFMARQKKTGNQIGLYAKSDNQSLINHVAKFSAYSFILSTLSTYNILGWNSKFIDQLHDEFIQKYIDK